MQAFGFLPELAESFPHRYVLNVQLLFPGKPRDGNSAIADQGFPPFGSIAFEEIQMAFVNEVVSDEDIVKYDLPFAPSSKCYWTRDFVRDLFLWGEISEDPARGYPPEGRFVLSMEDRLLSFVLSLGDRSTSFRDDPYRIVWKAIVCVKPDNFGGLDPATAISILKEALCCYGYDGRRNSFAPNRTVVFEF
ncbi:MULTISPECIES: hypothetical protein [unclassified Cyanobium]|uniref:hypothetical protein n=1 Tax=unclassified Cyanobium TaxID=2627006 RepID=UPI0020CEBF8C|nr:MULTISPECIES: hypothetical protein [unclassified Cyanobium]MCP9861156.1 hypothetical protein [Cyanobium sp. Cruz-8H5]MCP9868435.1 hypothetical protein [Cyanobium sp. Cruz-8D1]